MSLLRRLIASTTSVGGQAPPHTGQLQAASSGTNRFPAEASVAVIKAPHVATAAVAESSDRSNKGKAMPILAQFDTEDKFRKLHPATSAVGPESPASPFSPVFTRRQLAIDCLTVSPIFFVLLWFALQWIPGEVQSVATADTAIRRRRAVISSTPTPAADSSAEVEESLLTQRRRLSKHSPPSPSLSGLKAKATRRSHPQVGLTSSGGGRPVNLGRRAAGMMNVSERRRLYRHHDEESLNWLINQANDEEKRLANIAREGQEVLSQRSAEAAARRRNPAPAADDRTKWMPCHCTEFGLSDQRPAWCPSMPSKISSAHVCVVKNVCADSNSALYFQGAPGARGSGGQPSVSISIELQNTASIGATLLFDTGPRADPGGISYADTTNPDFYHDDDTTLVILGHSASHHITHFLEPVGTLQLGVTRMMQGEYPGKRQTFGIMPKRCAVSNLSCFAPPSLIVSTQAAMDTGSWQNHVLRVALRDFDGAASYGSFQNMRPSGSRKLRCWEKAVIPGTFYGLWPATDSASLFHSNLLGYLNRRGVKVPVGVEKAADRSAESEPSSGDDRLILIADRRTKRSVVDMDNLVSIAEAMARSVKAEVKVVQFGSLSFDEQASLAGRAGILLGIHGADLTNMIFQREGSVVVELNPLYFFENRFFELALALRHTYLAWTCSSAECAFGGDEAAFSEYARIHNLRYSAADASIEPKDGKRIRWNWIGYTGMACPDCNEASCCSPINNGYYSTLRDSNVRIGSGRHRREIEIVLTDAFLHLGWLDPDAVTPMPTPSAEPSQTSIPTRVTTAAREEPGEDPPPSLRGGVHIHRRETAQQPDKPTRRRSVPTNDDD